MSTKSISKHYFNYNPSDPKTHNPVLNSLFKSVSKEKLGKRMDFENIPRAGGRKLTYTWGYFVSEGAKLGYTFVEPPADLHERVLMDTKVWVNCKCGVTKQIKLLYIRLKKLCVHCYQSSRGGF